MLLSLTTRKTPTICAQLQVPCFEPRSASSLAAWKHGRICPRRLAPSTSQSETLWLVREPHGHT